MWQRMLLLTAVLLAVGCAHVRGARIKRVLQLSDVHLNLSATLDPADSARIPITYGQDAPIELLEAALAYAKQVIPDPDLLLYTGDHVAHGHYTDEYMTRTVATNVQMLEKYFPSATSKSSARAQATAILGNSDAYPDYSMQVTDPATETNPTITLVSGAWESVLSESDLDAFKRRGYLQYDIDDKLVLLTLNTVPYSIVHKPNTTAVEDPFDQFAWLQQTLLKIRENHKVAYISGHIPPYVDSYMGYQQWHEQYLVKYKTIVHAFADVIKAQLFGHVHSVEFRVPLDNVNNSTQLVPILVSGSISPLFGNNPSFVVYDIDADSYDLMDFTVYGTNISEADPNLEWKPLFTASSSYGVSSLSSSSLHDLNKRMAANTSLLEDYYWNMKAQSHRLPPCESSRCRAKILCTLQWWTSYAEYTACVNGAIPALDAITAAAVPTARRISASRAFFAIAVSTLISTIALAIAGAMVVLLRYKGVLKMPLQPEKPSHDAFPLV